MAGYLTMELSPCVVWEIVEGCNTFENFQKKMVPIFPADEAIPVGVRRRLGIIQKLILHSYFEYEFFDVALDRSFQALELALHLKYKILYPNKQGLRNLKPYLDWAVRENLLQDVDHKQLAYLRNHVAHPKEDNSMGMVGLGIIKFIVSDLIPGLFIPKTAPL